ncbi:F-BAR and double SH3 domains protein 2 [Desmophyllum pertusum]|uniref:F-BAR and double SH3 domains protein 2 n=1 Tax=Desmophyllum pertusum TaxID=174260 RepID=A0A9X0A4V9_9CNID|nr:F-BAR and double SH3 domains protein 2 [Desmophyllum pertusum]
MLESMEKCQDLTQKIHEELFETVRELSKAKKGYEEMEKLAQVAREQAADAEDKLKKKNVKFFQSKTSLEKNLNKSSSRRETCERRTAMARNEYILSLAAANAHMTRYFCKELQEIMSTLDGDFFGQLRGYFTTLGQVEVDACRNAMPGLETVVSHANTINRDVSLQSFLVKNKVFSEVVQYDFESCRHDKVRNLTTEHNAGLALNKEARKLAMRLAKDQMSLKANIKQLQAVKTTDDAEPPPVAAAAADGNQEGEQSAETLKESIRLIETNKLKTEACLDVLREAGVNVDEWMKSANSLSPNDMEANFHGSQNSLNSFNDDFTDTFDDDWEDLDDTFTADYSSDEDARSVSSNCSIPVACVALYNFEATDSEELTITEGEELEILDRDSEGWCKGRNKAGQTGFFPESYIEVGSSANQSPPQITPGSSYTDGHLGGSPVSVASIGQATSASTKYLCYVRALYDYEAMSDDEISFREGDIVGVLQTDDNNVDDGFWYGEFQGRRGVFPSLVVEDVPEGFQTTDTNMNVTDSLPLPTTSSCNTRAGDYITLPTDYRAGASAAPASNALQPVRKAPPPPASSPKIPRSTTMASGGARAMLPVDRQRAQTENSTAMKKPDSGAFARSMSQNPALQLKMYENIDQFGPIIIIIIIKAS